MDSFLGNGKLNLVSPRERTHSRIRVLFVIGTMGGGGAERQVIEILSRLDRSRFEPFLYLAMKQGELLPEVPADVPIHAYWDGQPETSVRRVARICRLTRLMRYLHLARVLRENQIDLIYDRTYLATLDAAGGCLFRPTPRISCCVVDPKPELQLHSRWSESVSWWFARRAYLTATVVLANSSGLGSRLIDYFRLPSQKVQVAYNLLPRIVESGSCDAAEHRPDRPYLIVNSGRLDPQKGQMFLLQAIDELVHRRQRSVRLVILGTGPLKAELSRFIDERHLHDVVSLEGFVTNATEWYRRADLFVLSSLYEGMPNALIEAAACGTPVLSTDCPSGPKEILDEGRCGGLVPPADAASLVNAIIDAMDHVDEWRQRAKNAQTRVGELFDPIAGIHRLQTLFEQVVGGSRQ